MIIHRVFRTTWNITGVLPDSENKIMHAIPRGQHHRAGQRQPLRRANRISRPPLTVRQPAEAERMFTALADDGQIQMPLAKTFFSPSFGMLADRFGVMWMVYVAQ